MNILLTLLQPKLPGPYFFLFTSGLNRRFRIIKPAGFSYKLVNLTDLKNLIQ